MAKLLNKDPAVYQQEQDNFVRELRKFHDQKGTGFRHIPAINGEEIDLYLLYWLVTAQGGWEKVNSNNGWEDLLESFSLDPGTTNGSLALKQTYLRFLDAYEKYFYLGEKEEEDGSMFYDEEDSRARRQRQQKIVTTVPSVYNEGQHRVTENIRLHYGMSTELYEPTDYDRLTLSLLSPLPNEQDFAINVATLLSNEGRHTLKLGKCPRLLDLLLAHAGVFNHHTHRNYMDDNYRESRGYDQVRFWRDVCRNSAVLELIYDEKNFYPKVSEPENFFAAEFSSEYNASTASGRLAQLTARAEHEVTDSDAELFAVGRSMGTREPTGQRVLQIATILRNISFEEDNVGVLAKNLTLLRFVLLCVNSSWSNLNQTGFDILSNIAAEIQLEEPGEDAVTDLMIKSLTRCIGDQDRFQVISALDVLNKFCGLAANEELLQRLLEGSVYRQLIDYLSLHDIHLLIATLECLYSLSSLGEQPCNNIVKTHSAIELLVSLVTVEAQSYGPKACILMRVVETVPQPGTQPAPVTQQQQQVQHPPVSVGGTPVRPQQPFNQTANPSLPKPSPAATTPRPSAPHAPHGTGGVAQPPPPGSQQVQLKVSNDEPHRVFCLSWLKATYETAPGKSIEQNIMYKQYLASMHRMGRREVISAQHYALCIRTLFGGSTGPNKKQIGDKMENHYTGIQVRQQPLPLKLTPAQAAAAQEASRQQGGAITIHQQAGQQVLLQQAQAPAQAVQQQQLQQQQLQQQQQQQQQVQVVQTSQQVIRPTPPVAQPQQVLAQGAQGQVMTIVNQQGQTVQGKLVNQHGQLVNQQGRLINQQGQLINQQGQIVNTQGVIQQGQVFQGQLVNSQGQIVNPQRQVVQGQIVSGQGVVMQGQLVNQQGQVVQGNVIQANQPHGQLVQNVVNAQGQIIQKRIISQPVQTVIQQPQQQRLQQGHVVVSGGQQQIVVQGQPGHVIVQGQPGQVVMQGQPGQIVQGQPGQVVQGQPGQIVQGQPGQVIQGQPGQVIQGQPGQVVVQGQVVQSSTGQTIIRGSQVANNVHNSVHSTPSSVAPSTAQYTSTAPVIQQSNMLKDLLKKPEGEIKKITGAPHDEILENGVSPLDGILPKDPSTFGLKVDELLEKKDMNGHKEPVIVPNHVDYSKLNGDSGKRGSDDTMENVPAKKPALEGVVTNGLTNGLVNGGNGVNVMTGGQVVQITPSSGQMQVSSGGQMLVSSAGQTLMLTTQAGSVQPPQLIQTSSGQLYLKTTTNGGGGIMAQQQQSGVLLQQPQSSVVLQPQQQQAVIVQQGGQQMYVIKQDQQQQLQQQQQQQVVQQVIQTSSGQQIVRQVVVAPSNTTANNQQLPVSTPNMVVGRPTNQVVVGQQANQVVVGQPTNQVVVGQSTNQVVVGQSTNQVVVGQPTNQVVVGQSTNQVVVGQSTNQVVVGQSTNLPMVHAAIQPPIMQSQSIEPVLSSDRPQSLTNGLATPPPVPSPQPCPSPPPVKIDPGKPFLCEWCNCMKSFKTPKEVERHAIAEHCPEDGITDMPCMWARCDGMKRKRFSLMTHLQDRHCHPQLMKLMAVRRVQIMQQGKSDVPLPPAPPPHPGYAPNAAVAAIKRHAQEFVSPKENEMKDEKEGPVTKSIRLTASLILRNLVIYSQLGRSRLRAYESHLSTVALSSVESSTTVAKILFDMSNTTDFQ